MLIFRGVRGEMADQNGKDIGLKDFDWLDGNYKDLKDLNENLTTWDFPPLKQWVHSPDEDLEPGQFILDRWEDGEGRMDPNGQFQTRYIARVMETSTPKNFVIK